MQTYNPRTAPIITMAFIVFGVGYATVKLTAQVASDWIESYLDATHDEARISIFAAMLIPIATVFLLPGIVRERTIYFWTVPIGLLVQAVMFWRRHSAPFIKALWASLAVGGIFTIAGTIAGTIFFVSYKVISFCKL